MIKARDLDALCVAWIREHGTDLPEIADRHWA